MVTGYSLVSGVREFCRMENAIERMTSSLAQDSCGERMSTSNAPSSPRPWVCIHEIDGSWASPSSVTA